MFESIQSYFTSIPSLHRALILAGGITFFWLVESAIPLFKFQSNKWRHASINIFFTLTTIVINFGFAFLMVKTSDWTIASNFGLLNMVSL
ncbi:MAG: sterol desaturase, partial [Chitinophagia bacterium]|nr:sterol desaturase [Chitinophagia bacterium]